MWNKLPQGVAKVDNTFKCNLHKHMREKECFIFPIFKFPYDREGHSTIKCISFHQSHFPTYFPAMYFLLHIWIVHKSQHGLVGFIVLFLWCPFHAILIVPPKIIRMHFRKWPATPTRINTTLLGKRPNCNDKTEELLLKIYIPIIKNCDSMHFCLCRILKIRNNVKTGQEHDKINSKKAVSSCLQ